MLLNQSYLLICSLIALEIYLLYTTIYSFYLFITADPVMFFPGLFYTGKKIT